MRSMRFVRYLSVFALLAVLLSACSSSAPSAPIASQPTSAPAPTEVAPSAAPSEAAPTAEPSAEAVADTPTETSSEANSAECEAGSFLFDHEFLLSDPICVPEDPERIVALDMASVELLLLLGKTPVGSASWLLNEMPVLIPEFAEELSKVEGLGYPAELEKLAVLKPDLILGSQDTVDVELASNIAPIIIADSNLYQNWQNGMQFWSQALNQADMYEAMEANYQTRIEELRAAVGNPAEHEISVIANSSYGVSLWLPNTPPGYVLADVGFSRPASQAMTGEAAIEEYGADQYISLSLERLDLVDADAIFYFTFAATDPESLAKEEQHIAEFQHNAVWQSLNAVKAGKAYFVPGYWWRAQTYYLANKVLDDLFANLTDTQATTPVLTFE